MDEGPWHMWVTGFSKVRQWLSLRVLPYQMPWGQQNPLKSGVKSIVTEQYKVKIEQGNGGEKKKEKKNNTKKRWKPEKHWMKEGKVQRDSPCQAVGPRPGCNEDHHPESAKSSLLAAPLFDHEPGCSSSSMWKYLVCCRRECLGKKIGRPAFLRPHSLVLPTFPGALPALGLDEGFRDLFLFFSCFLARIEWEVSLALISALWLKLRDRGIMG